ncbi:NUDIX hydrolase [Candidatus Harpocratesius sp.]
MSKNFSDTSDLILRIKNQIQKYKANSMEFPYLTPAAVLILVFKKKEDLFLIMTARSKRLHHHNGEMSFPGGKFDKKKDLNFLETALRETQEEIGISPKNIEIWGKIDNLPTLTGYNIYPFVGFIKKNVQKGDFVLNHNEVDEIVNIPLKFLIHLPKFDEIPFKTHNGKEYYVLSFNFQDQNSGREYNIWGASAHILANFLKITINQQKYSTHYGRPKLSEIQEFINSNRQKGNF